MRGIFQEILLKPLFSLLISIYNALPRPDLGVAVVILVILIRVLLWPLFAKMARSQLTFAKLQPEIERIQKKYKNDRTTQTRELLALYRKEGFSPFSGFLLILIQIPIIIALYQVFLSGVNSTDFSLLYHWVKDPGVLNYNFLGLVDLTKPFLLLTVLAGISQFLQSWQVAPKPTQGQKKSFQANFSRQLLWIGPIITIIILKPLPSVIALYWFLTSLISAGQQVLIERKLKTPAH